MSTVDLSTHLQASWKKRSINNTNPHSTYTPLTPFNYEEFMHCVSMNDAHNLKWKEPSELLHLLLSGYIRKQRQNIFITNDIISIIQKQMWMIPAKATQSIHDTYSMAFILNQYLNDPQNKCPYSKDQRDDFNILKYIYIRGGTLRDCCLMREINDIDIVLDAHALSVQFLYHLKQYHSHPSHQSVDDKCIFWRHYLHKFNPKYQGLWSELDRWDQIKSFRPFGTNASSKATRMPQNQKIESFLRTVEHCNFMINSIFLLDSLRKGSVSLELGAHGVMFRHYHWKLIWKSNRLDSYGSEYNYDFDIVDGPQGWYSAGGKVPDYKAVYGQPNITKFLQIMDEYSQSISRGDRNEISVPIYPIPFDVRYYDFTINAMHISFDSVLHAGATANWRDLIGIRHENKIINRYNRIGMEDVKNKVLKAPSLEVLTAASGQKYFERLRKMTHLFLHPIRMNIWKIDKQYLAKMSSLYCEWFVYKKDFNKNPKTWGSLGRAMHWFLVDCFSNSDWNRISESYFCETLHVFRCIRFETAFKMKMNKCSETKDEIQRFWINHLKIDNDKSLKKVKDLLWRFQYCSEIIDSLSCLENGVVVVDETETDDICTDEKHFAYFEEDKMRKKSVARKLEIEKYKARKTKKYKPFFKKKKDKESNAKSIKKYKLRYKNELQF
eukprot:230990_1